MLADHQDEAPDGDNAAPIMIAVNLLLDFGRPDGKAMMFEFRALEGATVGELKSMVLQVVLELVPRLAQFRPIMPEHLVIGVDGAALDDARCISTTQLVHRDGQVTFRALLN